MSLDTVLKIGKAFRNANNSLKNFKYVKPCPSKNGEITPLCLNISVNQDFKIDWDGIRLVPENEKPELYYLTFKTSDSDSLVKYIYGDIYFNKDVKIAQSGAIESKEGGYYRLGETNSIPAFQKSSFHRGQADYEAILLSDENGAILKLFRSSLENDLDILEKILANISAVEEFVSEKKQTTFTGFLYNEALMKEAALKKIYEKTSNQNRKKLGVESEFIALTDSEKHKLLSFDHGEIFIHFEFEDGKHWYEFKDDFNLISKKMLSDFVDSTPVGLVLSKTLYKTLCSGDQKNDWQFPSFALSNRYKSKFFTKEEVQDLFYALDFCSKGRVISGTDIKIIVLPKGENLNANDFEQFIKKRFDEGLVKKKNEDVEDPLLSLFEQENEEVITSFDVVFCKKGGASSPDVDLIEIAGIEKSKFRATRKKLEVIGKEVSARRKAFLKTDKNLYPFKLDFSFRNILGNPQYDLKTKKVSIKASPKYQTHMLKVLPLIYTENYYNDGVLLPAFIQNVEYSIRSGDNHFNLLKFDLEYLLKIQNSQNDNFMKIISSESYQLGLLLGSLAKSLSLEINSFEKNYVGNLTRRVSTLEDFIKLKNDIEQKLIMHEKSKYTFKASYELAQKVKDFQSRYDKEECVFGFFESYFEPIPKKEETSEN